MVNGLKFPSRLYSVEPERDTGTKQRAALWMAVEACRSARAET